MYARSNVCCLSLMTLVTATSFSQNRLEFSETVTVPNTTKEELYQRAVNWVNSYYSQYWQKRRVVNLKGNAPSLIVITSKFDQESSLDFDPGIIDVIYISYNLKIVINDNSYEYRFYDMEHVSIGVRSSFGYLTGTSTSPKRLPQHTLKGSDESWAGYKMQCQTEARSMMTSLEKIMKAPRIGDKAELIKIAREGFYSSHDDYLNKTSEDLGPMIERPNIAVKYRDVNGQVVRHSVKGSPYWGCRYRGRDFIFYSNNAMHIVVWGNVSLLAHKVDLSFDKNGLINGYGMATEINDLIFYVRKGESGDFRRINQRIVEEIIQDDPEVLKVYSSMESKSNSQKLLNLVSIVQIYALRHP